MKRCKKFYLKPFKGLSESKRTRFLRSTNRTCWSRQWIQRVATHIQELIPWNWSFGMQCTADSPPHSSTWDEESGCTCVQQASPKHDPHFEKWDFFQNHTTSFAFPTAETGISGKGTWKQPKKRVVFYIQINLYFCHKTLKVKRRLSTQSFVKDPQNTLSPLHMDLQEHRSILQSCNYFLWTFFSPLPLHVQFPGTILHRSTEKQVCKGLDSESRCFLPSGEYLSVKQQQQQKTCYWKSSHKHLNQVFWICLGANLIKMLLA